MGKSKPLSKSKHEDSAVLLPMGLPEQESKSYKNGSDLAPPVSPAETGLGLPYAPENWPNPGDIWRWKAGKRILNSGYYQDRFLYLPPRLQKLSPWKEPSFRSKSCLTKYLESQFPGTDIQGFHASFTWKIPAKVCPTTAGQGSSGGASKKTIKPYVVNHGRTKRTGKKVKRALDKSDSEVIVSIHSPRHGLSGEILKRSDAEVQKRGELGNNRFSCYMEILWSELPEDKKGLCTWLDPLYFFLYANKAHKQNVVDWIKKENISAKKYVFIPSVEGHHWRLFILCHSYKNDQSESKVRCILLLDSLQARQSKYLFEDRIRSLIHDVYKYPEGEEKIKQIPLLVPKVNYDHVPQQANDKDCGYFILYYIKLFIDSAPEDFSISDGYPYFMTKSWFTYQELECFYSRLDQLHQSNQNISDDVSVGSSDIEEIADIWT